MSHGDFAKARAKVEESYKRMDNATIRKLYAYYKQATLGDISGKRPGGLRIRDRIKFDAWSSVSGMSKEVARASYIDLVNKIELNSEAVSCDTREGMIDSE